MIPLATQTVTVRRAGTASDHGNTIADWSAATEHTINGCSVQPAGGVEDPINRDSVTTLWHVYAPAGADVQDTDRIVVYGELYEVDGPVRRWATGLLDHVEFDLKAVTG